MNEAHKTDVARLREQGVVILRDSFPKAALVRLKAAAEACFEAIESGKVQSAVTCYRLSPISSSVIVPALLDYSIDSHEELKAPLRALDLDRLIAVGISGDYTCDLGQSWVRKRYAPPNAPRQYHPNTWHQDGGLGVSYDFQPGSAVAMTQLVTCWIPLQDCDGNCPGLEFVRVRLNGLLHYTELQDERLRSRFSSEQFWAPDLSFGDGLLFLADSLHRTHTRPEMQNDRLSLEYRFFPASHSAGADR